MRSNSVYNSYYTILDVTRRRTSPRNAPIKAEIRLKFVGSVQCRGERKVQMKRTLTLFYLVLWAFTFCIASANCQEATQQSTGATQQQQTAAEPYSIKADKLGETFEAWMANYPKDRCGKFGDKGWWSIIPGEQVCYAKDIFVNETYAGDPVHHSAYFYQGKLYRVELSTCYECSLGIAAALLDKYGEPTSKKTVTMTNGFGAHFERLILVWGNGVSTITYQGFDYSLGSSKVIFTLDEIDKPITIKKSGADSAKAHTDM